MQERTSLEDALQGIGKVERELSDNVEMIELGEAENDAGVVTDVRGQLLRVGLGLYHDADDVPRLATALSQALI